jgi:hypothetical protein
MMRIAWLAPDGTQVQPGDVVIRFDPTDLETRLLEGRTERATAEARIERTQVREASAGKNLERDAKMAAVELDYAQKYQSKDPDVFSRVDIAKSEIDAKLAAARKDNAEEVRGIRGAAGRGRDRPPRDRASQGGPQGHPGRGRSQGARGAGAARGHLHAAGPVGTDAARGHERLGRETPWPSCLASTRSRPRSTCSRPTRAASRRA